MTLVDNTKLGASESGRFVPGADDTPLEEQVDALIVYGPLSEASFGRLCRLEDFPPLLCDEARDEHRSHGARVCVKTPPLDARPRNSCRLG